MAIITNYTTLQTEVGNFLNRSDLSNDIPAFIDSAEKRFAQDTRLRKLKSAAFSITADDVAAPADFLELQSWYHDGTSNFGPIEIVGADHLPILKTQYGSSGVPAFAALLDAKFRFAPAPDGTYSTKMVYWRTIGSVASATSWLFDTDPYLYLYGALVEASPFLKDDARAGVWNTQVETRIENIYKTTQAAHFSGSMRRRSRAIGG